MTDMERAEEFANNGYALGCTKSPFEASKEGFLAGLKAARKEMWHDLRKNPKDLPDACLNIVNQDGEKVRYDYVNEVWRTDDSNDYICDDPIAWCEVPTFTDKE